MPESATEIKLAATLVGPSGGVQSRSKDWHFDTQIFAGNLTQFRDQIDAMIARLRAQITLTPATDTTPAIKEAFEIAITMDFYNDKTASIALKAGQLDPSQPDKIVSTLTCYCNGP